MPKTFSKRFIQDIFQNKGYNFEKHAEIFDETKSFMSPLMGFLAMIFFYFFGHFFVNAIYIAIQITQGLYLFTIKPTTNPSAWAVRFFALSFSICSKASVAYYLVLCDKVFKNQGGLVFSVIGCALYFLDYTYYQFGGRFDDWVQEYTIQKAKWVLGSMHFTCLLSLFFVYFIHQKIRRQNAALLGLAPVIIEEEVVTTITEPLMDYERKDGPRKHYESSGERRRPRQREVVEEEIIIEDTIIVDKSPVYAPAPLPDSNSLDGGSDDSFDDMKPEMSFLTANTEGNFGGEQMNYPQKSQVLVETEEIIEEDEDREELIIETPGNNKGHIDSDGDEEFNPIGNEDDDETD